jgi:hypothetical protein
MKKLEAVHHRWQRKLLGVTWKDTISNNEVKRTGLQKIETADGHTTAKTNMARTCHENGQIKDPSSRAAMGAGRIQTQTWKT